MFFSYVSYLVFEWTSSKQQNIVAEFFTTEAECLLVQ